MPSVHRAMTSPTKYNPLIFTAEDHSNYLMEHHPYDDANHRHHSREDDVWERGGDADDIETSATAVATTQGIPSVTVESPSKHAVISAVAAAFTLSSHDDSAVADAFSRLSSVDSFILKPDLSERIPWVAILTHKASITLFIAFWAFVRFYVMHVGVLLTV